MSLLFRLTLLIALLRPASDSSAENITVDSPDQRLSLTLVVSADGKLSHALSIEGKQLIEPSCVGFDGAHYIKVTRHTQDSLWYPLWGKRSKVRDHYNEALLELDSYKLQVRAYNNGIAFRYLFPDKQPASSEATSFRFSADYLAWYYNGENHNLGPEKLSAAKGRRRPVVTIHAGSHGYLALHEADLNNGEPLLLEARPEALTLAVASKPSTAWRVLLYGRNPGDLVDSHLLELLCPPPATDLDFSWVKPGVAVWDWRIDGAQVSDFRYEMSLPSWKRMVDFAAENKIPYLVLDANWYGPEFRKDSDPLKGGKVDQVGTLIEYAKNKKVGVWLYLNDVGGTRFPLAQTLAQYADWGAVGVKYGFMIGNPEEKNSRTREITEMCARNKLLCNFHDDPVHPFGQLRTWPNALTREYCQAQLDGHKTFQPSTFVTSVFVNMLAGPLDMNNGLADLTQRGRVDHGVPVPSTLTAEVARTLIVFSGAIVIPDVPEYYRKHPELLRFIAAEQMPWKESITLSGEIGEYILMARQAATGNWLVGAATNETPREIQVPLTFLGSGKYKAMIIQDGPSSDYRTQAEDYCVQTLTVSNTDLLTIKLAPGGGACLLFE